MTEVCHLDEFDSFIISSWEVHYVVLINYMKVKVHSGVSVLHLRTNGVKFSYGTF